LHFVLHQKNGAKCGKSGLEAQKGVDLRVKMPQKRENAIFCISTKMGYKVYITGV
jgi:hypothetical protein